MRSLSKIETCVTAAFLKMILSSSDSEMKIVTHTYVPTTLLNLCLLYISLPLSLLFSLVWNLLIVARQKLANLFQKEKIVLNFFSFLDKICLPVFSSSVTYPEIGRCEQISRRRYRISRGRRGISFSRCGRFSLEMYHLL